MNIKEKLTAELKNAKLGRHETDSSNKKTNNYA